jgi:hypothetical protein
MKLLIIISTSQSAFLASSLISACERASVSWAVFFTNDGVRTLADTLFISLLNNARYAVAKVSCHESWQTHMGDAPCPVEEGSQTNNSAMAANADKIISL